MLIELAGKMDPVLIQPHHIIAQHVGETILITRQSVIESSEGVAQQGQKGADHAHIEQHREKNCHGGREAHSFEEADHG